MSTYAVGDVNDILSMLSILGLLLYFLIPTFVVILIINTYLKIKKRKKNKESIQGNKQDTNKEEGKQQVAQANETQVRSRGGKKSKGYKTNRNNNRNS